MSKPDQQYKCVFFDLDHTLWDYETNSRVTLHELYIHYELQAKGITHFEDFFLQFRTVNQNLWDLYDRGLIDNEVIRKERFKKILTSFHLHEEKLSRDISEDYLATCPKKGCLMPQAMETLEYLSEHYMLTVITNGFEEIQKIKLMSGKLDHYFDHIITSQKAGHKKPAREIFEFALQINDILHHQAIMVGDNPIADIRGAKNARIDAVFFNPEKNSHAITTDYEIHSLEQLREIL
jgi:YjjG family noncanonical pyrimidine nucleotidase